MRSPATVARPAPTPAPPAAARAPGVPPLRAPARVALLQSDLLTRGHCVRVDVRVELLDPAERDTGLVCDSAERVAHLDRVRLAGGVVRRGLLLGLDGCLLLRRAGLGS